MSLRVRVCVPVLVAVLLAPQSSGVDNPSAPAAAGSESALAGGVRRFERDLAEHVLLRSRINVLHPNPQSVLDGLQAGFVNVSSGNLTFARRDIVVPGRRRLVFARIHDSRIRPMRTSGPAGVCRWTRRSSSMIAGRNTWTARVPDIGSNAVPRRTTFRIR